MKTIKFTLAISLCFTLQVNAQKALCNFQKPYPHNVYIFSCNTTQTMLQLYGDTVPEFLLNRLYISTESQRCEIDSLVITGKLDEGIFIFPDKDAAKTIRFCNVKEYAEAIKSKMELRIE